MSDRSVAATAALCVFAASAVVLVGGASALADFTLVHESNEDYHASGGTSVFGCSGEACEAMEFTVGDVSGAVLWEIEEKVYKDTTVGSPTEGYTRFVYTIGNDGFAPLLGGLNPEYYITGLDVTHATGFSDGVGTQPIAPPWTFTQGPTNWTWAADDPSTGGVAHTLTMNTMTVEFDRLVDVVFDRGAVAVWSADGGLVNLAMDDWVITSVPEPGTALLAAAGLALAMLRRRRPSTSH